VCPGVYLPGWSVKVATCWPDVLLFKVDCLIN